MKVFLATLGCPKNTVDSEAMVSLLDQAGHKIVDSPSAADVLVVNTCGFIEPARQESLHLLRQLGRRKRRHQALVAAGCLTQLWSGRLQQKVPAIDALIGTRRWGEIVSLVEALSTRPHGQRNPPVFLGDAAEVKPDPDIQRQPAGPSAYVKIADGCSAPCSFCAIPLIKGPAHSRSPESIVREARRLVDGGARELILIAQDTTAYGRDLGLEDALPDLISQILSEVPEMSWLRVMYAYPREISPRLIEVMAMNKQVCHYLDVPLQHGHPAVLRRMRRPHDVKSIIKQIDDLRSAMPDIALRTSLIVGFPGETEQEFQGLLEFVDAIAFDRVGAFTFSAEAGTAAADLPHQVPAEVKRERYDRLMQRQQIISAHIQARLVEETFDLLVDGHGDGISVGRTYRDAPEIDGFVIVAGEEPVGHLAPVRITGAGDYDLWGEWA